jgi:ribosomal protein L16/L10AE
MLMPKRVKYRKQHCGRAGLASRARSQFWRVWAPGIGPAAECRQIEAARRAIVRYLRRRQARSAFLTIP